MVPWYVIRDVDPLVVITNCSREWCVVSAWWWCGSSHLSGLKCICQSESHCWRFSKSDWIWLASASIVTVLYMRQIVWPWSLLWRAGHWCVPGIRVGQEQYDPLPVTFGFQQTENSWFNYQTLLRNPAALHRSWCWILCLWQGPGLLLSLGTHRVAFFWTHVGNQWGYCGIQKSS